MKILHSRFGGGKIHQATNGERGRCNPGVPWSLKYVTTDGEADNLTCAKCRKLAGLEPLERPTVSEKDAAKLAAWKGEVME